MPTRRYIAGLHGAAYYRMILVFLAPALFIYTLFSVYPLIATITYSFFHTSGTGHEFVGLANFATLLGDETWSAPFWNAFRNTCTFFAIHMLVQNPVGMAIAAMLSIPRLPQRDLYRTLIFMPTMLSVVIIGFIWQLILSPLWGISRGFLNFFGLGFLFAPWLGQESTALVTISLISVWQFVGIPMIVIYASLLAIPKDYTDAAAVDGLNQYRIFMYVKLPLIAPTIGMISILTFVGNFNAFDLVYTVKGALAGPNFSTDIMGTLFYRAFFGNQLQPGDPNMGAAIATMVLFMIFCGIAFYLFVIQRRIQRYGY